MKITIELTTEQERFLRQFAENQHEGAKDNVCTRKPLHLVEDYAPITVAGHNDNGRELWMYDWESCESLRDLAKNWGNSDNPIEYDDALYEDINGVFVDDEESYCKAYDVDFNKVSKVTEISNYRTVAYFWTLAEAKKYIKYQSHNLTKPRTYTVSGGYGNNGDYEPFWDLLMAAGKQVIDLQDKGMEEA